MLTFTFTYILCQSGSQSSAVAALECRLTWIETQLLPCVMSTGSRHRRPRRLLTSASCTLMSDPEADYLSESVFMSDTSVIGRPDVSAESRDFVTSLIKVSLYMIDRFGLST